MTVASRGLIFAIVIVTAGCTSEACERIPTSVSVQIVLEGAIELRTLVEAHIKSGWNLTNETQDAADFRLIREEWLYSSYAQVVIENGRPLAAIHIGSDGLLRSDGEEARVILGPLAAEILSRLPDVPTREHYGAGTCEHSGEL